MDLIGDLPCLGASDLLSESPRDSTPSQSGAFRNALALNARGDQAYYDGYWGQAQQHFAQAGSVALLDRAPTGDPAWHHWDLTARIALNLGMLGWLRGDHGACDRHLALFSLCLDRVPDRKVRWELDLNAKLFLAFQARSEGEWERARVLLQAILPLEGDRQSALVLQVRVGLETANLMRQDADYLGAAIRLRHLYAPLHELRRDEAGRDGNLELVLVYERSVRHFLLVNQVERVLFEGLARRLAVSELARDVALVFEAVCRDRRSPVGRHPSQDGLRVFAARERKVLGWAYWLFGAPDAEAIAQDAAEEARARGDWRTACLSQALRGAAMAQQGGVEGGFDALEGAYRDAETHRYWKGRLLSSVLGLRTAIRDGSTSRKEHWVACLRSVPEAGGPGLRRLTDRHDSWQVHEPLAAALIRETVDEVGAEVDRGSCDTDDLAAPGVRRILAMGASAVGVLEQDVRERGRDWSAILQVLTGATTEADRVFDDLRGTSLQ